MKSLLLYCSIILTEVIFNMARNTMSINYISDKADQDGDFMIKLKEGNMSRKVEDGQQQVMYTKEGSSEIKQWKSSVSDGNIVLNSQDMPDINQSGTYSVVVTVNGEIFPSTGKVTLTLESSYPTKDNYWSKR